MGKLHTLRRAILRDPDKWKWYRWTDLRGHEHVRERKGGAVRRRDGTWKPNDHLFWRSTSNGPYRKFIEKVLKEIGPQ